MIVHIFCLVTSLGLFAANVSASLTYGQQFPRQGPAGDSVMLPEWEISYYAENYKPVCGVSNEKEGDFYWSNSDGCEPAMRVFLSSSERVQIYDTKGAVTNSQFGGGSQLCLCFAVQFLPKPGQGLDICLAVSSAGQVIIRDGVAEGIQSPQANTAKLLPLCGANQESPDNRFTPISPSNTGPRIGGITSEASIKLATWLSSMTAGSVAVLGAFLTLF